MDYDDDDDDIVEYIMVTLWIMDINTYTTLSLFVFGFRYKNNTKFKKITKASYIVS